MSERRINIVKREVIENMTEDELRHYITVLEEMYKNKAAIAATFSCYCGLLKKQIELENGLSALHLAHMANEENLHRIERTVWDRINIKLNGEEK